MSPVAMLEVPKFWRLRMQQYLKCRARQEEIDMIEAENARPVK